MKANTRWCGKRPEGVGGATRSTATTDTSSGGWRRRRQASTRYLRALALTSALNSLAPVAQADPPSSDQGLGDRTTRAVHLSQRLALRQLSRQPACQALFDELGRSGAQLVTEATFRVATPAESFQVCQLRRGALFTTVGGQEIALCPRVFLRLPTRAQAATLLHEALHHAGVSERPWDPDGMTSEALTELVERRCNL